jgi:hypothetical protein
VITIQYLEDAPDLPARTASSILDKLRAAARILPFSHLLIGWNLPTRLLEACRKEADQLGLRLLRWHPLLTGDAVFQPNPDWQVIGAGGRKVPGYRGMPEFTFVCPNHPAVQEKIHQRVIQLAQEGLYHGFFLDRVRFPSPSSNPVQDLGCFCERCRQRAAVYGLDLERVRHAILRIATTAEGRLALVGTLLGGSIPGIEPELVARLNAFLDFRQVCVTDFIAQICTPLQQAGMEIGLDCFSPGLTRMVGQDLKALGPYADWIKVMSYAHTLGPAGIPYELSGYYDYLSEDISLNPADILHSMGDALGLELPATLEAIKEKGILPSALEAELRRGVRASSIPILAGFELVQIPGVAELNDVQILSDLEAVKRAEVAGLSISWDLWDIPLERLELVHRIFPNHSHNLTERVFNE